MRKLFKILLLLLSINSYVCLSQQHEEDRSSTDIDISSYDLNKFGVALYGTLHGLMSISLIGAFVGTATLIYDINFDPYRGVDFGYFDIVRYVIIEELEQSYFIYPIMRSSSNFIFNQFFLLNIDNENIDSTGVILSCTAFSLLHLNTASPSILQIVYTFPSFPYCISVTSVKNNKGFMAGAISHIVMNLIGFKLLNLLRWLHST